MSRYLCEGVAKDQNGNVLPSATIVVTNYGTSTVSTIYEASSGGTAVASVTSNVTTGKFSFWVDTANYTISQLFTITISKAGYATQSYNRYVIRDISTTTVSFKELTADYVIQAGDMYNLYVCDCTAGNINITLPEISGITFKQYLKFIKTDASANTLTLTRSGSDTIIGYTTWVLTMQWEGRELAPNTNRWLVI